MTVTSQFNLLDDPWIPCGDGKGPHTVNLSVLQCLAEAASFQEIRHASPLVNLGLHRLLIAFLYSVYRGPDRVSRVAELLDAGRFDMSAVNRYADAWRHRFELFGDRPFLQDPTLSAELETDRDQPLSIEQLRRESAAPTSVTLFDHTLATSSSLPFCDAACYLVADQFFALQDGRGYTQATLSSGLASRVAGSTLFETLVLNLIPYNVNSPIKSPRLEADRPAWEHDTATIGPVPDGWLDYLTRPYRRLLLVSDGGSVTHVYRKAGVPLDRDWRAASTDPWLAYVVKDKGTYPLSLWPERALWRDSHALLNQFARVENQNPGWVRLLQRLGRQTTISVVGVVANNNAVSMWREERLPARTELLTDESLRAAVQHATASAERVARVLRTGAELLLAEVTQPIVQPLNKSPCRRKPHPGAKKAAKALGIERIFWAGLDLPFRAFLDRVADDSRGAQEAWAARLAVASNAAFNHAAGQITTNARGFRAAALVRDCFERDLRNALQPLLSDRIETSTPGEVTS